MRAGDRYVALGSSFAAGPGLRPRSPGSPRRAGRSAHNYAHLLAADLGLDLVDASTSGATAEAILRGVDGRSAQVDAVSGDTKLVTITCGGNDVGYVPGLVLGSLPRPVRALPMVRRRLAGFGVRSPESFARLAGVFDDLIAAVRQRAPHTRVLWVDYLTILPSDPALPTAPLSAELAEWGRATADRLAAETRAAADRAGCGHLGAADASREHHAWSAESWTTGWRRWPGSGAPYHPNPRGMRAVAELLRAEVASGPR